MPPRRTPTHDRCHCPRDTHDPELEDITEDLDGLDDECESKNFGDEDLSCDDLEDGRNLDGDDEPAGLGCDADDLE